MLLLWMVVVTVRESAYHIVGADVLKAPCWMEKAWSWGSEVPSVPGRYHWCLLVPAWTWFLPLQTTLICRLSRRGAVSYYRVLLASGILSELYNRLFCFLKHFLLLSLIMLRFPVNAVSCNYHLQISGFAKLFLKGIFFFFSLWISDDQEQNYNHLILNSATQTPTHGKRKQSKITHDVTFLCQPVTFTGIKVCLMLIEWFQWQWCMSDGFH